MLNCSGMEWICVLLRSELAKAALGHCKILQGTATIPKKLPAARPTSNTCSNLESLSQDAMLAYMLRYLGMKWYLLELTFYATGVGLYAVCLHAYRVMQPDKGSDERLQFRISERLAPGRFDIWGSSHQIFHAAILCAMYARGCSIERVHNVSDTGYVSNSECIEDWTARTWAQIEGENGQVDRHVAREPAYLTLARRFSELD
ncbi:hypothetical protein Purlil1_13078 [Purpureocillium lilacinum]|uniref:Uncharacterized protein n=1 Tax=Purpureocillium lilacinum TaxID=33203 RepID=A0ABR0BF55_PURLI|nr:hypothetical protein Purlil1_13078 [Purpureocillium lilacinum]